MEDQMTIEATVRFSRPLTPSERDIIAAAMAADLEAEHRWGTAIDDALGPDNPPVEVLSAIASE